MSPSLSGGMNSLPSRIPIGIADSNASRPMATVVRGFLSSDLTHGVAGLVVEVLPGLEAEHYLFISQDGDLTGGGQILLGVDIAPRLVIEPRVALSWSAQEIPGEGLGNGLTDVEASLRLRRSIGQHFNLYTGVVHERLLGSTRSIAVAAGDPARVTRAVVGLGFTF
jgi:copper resistance protein B